MDELGQRKMSVREAMITLAGKPFSYGEQQRWLKRVADAANISVRSARALWRGEIHNHNHRAAVAVQIAVELKHARTKAKAIEEANALANQYRKIIAGMELADSEFHGPHIAALLDALRAMGRLDRS